MSSSSTNKSPCRICLKTKVFFDWTESIFEFSGPSYKECYYQYTHLQEHEDDYTQMLCLECGNCLRNTYQLVEKALESIKRLDEMKTEIKSADPLEYEKECNTKYSLTPNTKDALNANTENQEIDKSIKLDEEVLINDFTAIQDSDSKHESDDSNSLSSNNHSELQKVNVGLKRRGFICAYCSKIFTARCHLIKHELIHDRNRERTASCAICGLKFFDNQALRNHMPVHDENRIREYKCEFCVKAFFSRGGLNVHRRMHLGQMVKCKFCSKEYCRQLDLDRHMATHDVSRITANAKNLRKVKEKYITECNICGQKINRDCWKAHEARHLKQPLMQCGLCNKTYYCRKSVRRHIKQCHDVAEEDNDKAIISLSINKKFKPRHSSLMKKQNIELK